MLRNAFIFTINTLVKSHCIGIRKGSENVIKRMLCTTNVNKKFPTINDSNNNQLKCFSTNAPSLQKEE